MPEVAMLLVPLFRRAFWVSDLLCLGVGAWLVAGTVNAVAGSELREIPDLGAATSWIPAAPAPVPVDLSTILERNLFGSSMAAAGPDDGDDREKTPEVVTDLPASLAGTVVAEDPRWSLSLIVDRPRSETGFYRVGDPLMGEARVVAIRSDRVYLERAGRLEVLALGEEAPARPAGRAERPSAPDGIQQTGPDRFRIARAEFERIMGNLGREAARVRIVPAFDRGRAAGFKVFSIRPGSTVSRLGLRNGDIVRKVDGYAITGPEVALQVLQRIKRARRVEVEITRGGRTVGLTFTID
jgi:general secretion pathway protein C